MHLAQRPRTRPTARLVLALLVWLLASSLTHAAPPALKLLVEQDGFHAVTGAALAQAGLPLDEIRPERLALSCSGESVARRLLGVEQGRLTPVSLLLFYAQSLSTRWTGTNVYWLTWDGRGVLEMPSRDLPAPSGLVPASFPATLRLEENREYGYLIWVPDPGELDPWFWQTIRAGQTATIPFDLPHLAPESGPAHLRVCLRGRSANLRVSPDHHLTATLNGHPAGEVFFDNQDLALLEASLPAGLLRVQGNELSLTVPGDTASGDLDQVFLDWVELDYPRTFAATAQGLDLRLPAGAERTVRLTDLPGAAADLYDLSDPLRPVFHGRLPTVEGRLAFGLPAGPACRLIAVPPGACLRPEIALPAFQPNLRSPLLGADYLVLSPPELLPALEPLLTHRRAEGLRVEAVPLPAIYDQFAAGITTPHALRTFLQYAHDHWAGPAPQYVLLVGDASSDPRGYLGASAPDLLPAYPVRLRDGVETPFDLWYACFEGAQTPRLAVGRFPVRTPAQAARFVAKTLACDGQDLARDEARRLLVIADHELQTDDPSWFEQSVERLWQYLLPFGYRPQAHYLRLTGISRNRPAAENRDRVRATATPALLQAWREGVGLVIFEGHGGARYWSREQVLTAEDAVALDNTWLPLAVDITCFSGQFDRPDLPGAQCLAEVLLTAPGGAAACLSPSRLGGLPLHHELTRLLAEAGPWRLGPLLVAARQRFAPGTDGFWAPRDTYNLLGDPALRVPLASPAVLLAQAAGERGEVPPDPDWSPTGRARFPDLNHDRVDDRLEQMVADRLAAGEPDAPLEVILTLHRRTPLDEAAALAVSLGAEVRFQSPRRSLLTLRLPARAVPHLAEALGGNLMLLRWAGHR